MTFPVLSLTVREQQGAQEREAITEEGRKLHMRGSIICAPNIISMMTAGIGWRGI
jgi:hypothetical protein